MSKNLLNQIVDATRDGIDKVSSPASRAGHTVERVGKMREAGVDDEVIALQMSKQSANSNTYNKQDVQTLDKLYQDTKTKVVITSEQARALIADQQENNNDVISVEIQPD